MGAELISTKDLATRHCYLNVLRPSKIFLCR